MFDYYIETKRYYMFAWLLFVMVVICHWPLQLDINNVSLHGYIEEEIFKSSFLGLFL